MAQQNFSHAQTTNDHKNKNPQDLSALGAFSCHFNAAVVIWL